MSKAYVVVGSDGLSSLVDESEVLGAMTRSQLRRNALTKHAALRTGPLRARPATPGSSSISNERNTLANIYDMVGVLQAHVGEYSERGDISTDAAVVLLSRIEDLFAFIQSRQALIESGKGLIPRPGLVPRPY